MPRPDQTHEKRRELLPLVTATFAELGYRRASTAVLAQRCGVQVNILYRLWPDKQAMFLAAVEHVFDYSLATWRELLEQAGDPSEGARQLLRYEAEHLGEHGFYRILFAGLGETDDPAIIRALGETFGRFVSFIRSQVAAHRGAAGPGSRASAERAAWAFLGLGTAANIGRELGLLSPGQRSRLFTEIGELLLDG